MNVWVLYRNQGRTDCLLVTSMKVQLESNLEPKAAVRSHFATWNVLAGHSHAPTGHTDSHIDRKPHRPSKWRTSTYETSKTGKLVHLNTQHTYRSQWEHTEHQQGCATGDYRAVFKAWSTIQRGIDGVCWSAGLFSKTSQLTGEKAAQEPHGTALPM